MVGTPSKLAIDEKNVRNLITNVCDRRSLDVTLDVCDRRSLDVYVIAHYQLINFNDNLLKFKYAPSTGMCGRMPRRPQLS